MSTFDNIELIDSAIKSVKKNAEIALNKGDFVSFTKLMADKQALSLCLETEVSKFLSEVETMKNRAA